MKTKNTWMISGLILLASIPLGHEAVRAHEGHAVPGAAMAKHGGTLKETRDLYLELARKGAELRLYPMTHALQPIPLAEVKVKATARLPKAKATTALAFAPTEAGDPAQAHFLGTFDAKGAHRFQLEVQVTYKGKTERVEFQVEPRED